MSGLKRRMRIEFALAIASAALFLLTLVNSEWIEEVFGVEPDAGSGVLEWAITLGCLGASVVLGAVARADLRRIREAVDERTERG